MGELVLGQQLSAGRALIKLTQEELARAAGLHVNSVRYLERQKRITTAFSSKRVEQAMLRFGVIFFRAPSPGVRFSPNEKEFG
jgi:transcriptional regulator with XRE-family HTH domain